MSNPFEDPVGTYLVLVNDEGQHSLWPGATAVPAGWRVVHGPASRDQCLAYVDDNWTDMRPASLIRSSQAGAGTVGPAGGRSEHWHPGSGREALSV